VGLCDNNPGRLQFVKEYIGTDCPTFANTSKGTGLAYKYSMRSSLVMISPGIEMSRD